VEVLALACGEEAADSGEGGREAAPARWGGEARPPEGGGPVG